jgi:GNAT superfamily N-acetyltransferase
MTTEEIPAVTGDMVRAARLRLAREDIAVDVAAPGEYAGVEALSRAADPAEMKSVLTAGQIAWFIDRNPCGRGFIVVARDPVSHELAGYFLFYPWLLARRTAEGPQRLPAFLYVHLYVAPPHRRRGVFAAMTRFGLDLVAQLGVGLAYTVPNPRSTPGFLKFGMTRAGLLPFWIRPVVPGWGLVAGAARREPLEVRTISELPADAPDASATLPAAVATWSPRQPAVYRWRYRERPGVPYELRVVTRAGAPIAVVVTRRMTIKGWSTLALCDAWFSESGPAALRLAIDDALRSGERVRVAIAFGGNASAPYRQALRGAGFVVCPAAFQPQPVAILGGGVGGPPGRVELPDVDTWHLTPYDWDVF